MMSRNGISKQFRFTIIHKITGAETNYDFSFKHQALEEWTLEKWLYDTNIGGDDIQGFLYVHNYFKIDWAELIVGDDADMLKEIRNAEYQGHKLLITPHIDVPGRAFEVFSLKNKDGDSQEINFSQIVNHRNSPGNKGTIMYYKTVKPQYSWDIVDPSMQQGVSALGMEEFA